MPRSATSLSAPLAITDRDRRGKSANSEIYHVVIQLSRSFARACDDIARHEGVTAAEVNVLLVLGEGIPMSSAQLAQRSLMTPQASHQLVARLLSGGWIKTSAHPSNRRVRLVSLTEDGWGLLERVRRALGSMQDRSTVDLSERERDQVRERLLVMVEAMNRTRVGD